jgi:hypothetical protein
LSNIWTFAAADQDKLRKVYRLLGKHVKRWVEAR